MDPLIGGALIGIGGSLLGGLFNSKSQSQANATNLKISREQREWNEKMWNKNNAYNTPLAQMQRYAAAGLNPNLIYGQGTSGVSSSPAQGVDAPTVRPNWHLDTQMVGQAMQIASQIKVNDSVAEKNIQDAALARSQAALADANRSRVVALLPYEQEDFDYRNAISGFAARKQYDRYGREVLGWEATNANIWAQTAKLKSENTQIQEFVKQMPQRLALDKMNAMSKRISANASVIAAAASRTMAQTAGARLELDWNANTWQSHRAAVQNMVSEADIRSAGALYSKLLSEGRGQDLENELVKKWGSLSKAVSVGSSIVDAASNFIRAIKF